MLVFTKSKINLGLQITGRLDNGYHTLNTVMWPIGWGDILEVVPAADQYNTSLTITGRQVDCPMEKNLVIKALRALERQINRPIPIDIYLRKIVPDGAGLGGGSADASAMLMLLNRMFKLNFSHETLTEISATIGADCPFFISATPQLATDTGATLNPIDIPAMDDVEILVVKPPVAVSTAQAYAGIDSCLLDTTHPVTPTVGPHPGASADITDILSRPIIEWRDLLVNDFERSVFPQLPILADIKQQLYDLGALYASMSGSGSALYGLFAPGTHPTALPATWADYSVWTSSPK